MNLMAQRIIVTGCASGTSAATVLADIDGGTRVVAMDVSNEVESLMCVDGSASGPGIFMPSPRDSRCAVHQRPELGLRPRHRCLEPAT